MIYNRNLLDRWLIPRASLLYTGILYTRYRTVHGTVPTYRTVWSPDTGASCTNGEIYLYRTVPYGTVPYHTKIILNGHSGRQEVRKSGSGSHRRMKHATSYATCHFWPSKIRCYRSNFATNSIDINRYKFDTVRYGTVKYCTVRYLVLHRILIGSFKFQ